MHVLDLKISDDGIDVYRKDAHTGQYSQFSSFEPFSRKTAWINSLVFRAIKICSTPELLNKQLNRIKTFMSWNGFPGRFRNAFISKLKNKFLSSDYKTPSSQLNGFNPKIWLRLPYLISIKSQES